MKKADVALTICIVGILLTIFVGLPLGVIDQNDRRSAVAKRTIDEMRKFETLGFNEVWKPSNWTQPSNGYFILRGVDESAFILYVAKWNNTVYEVGDSLSSTTFIALEFYLADSNVGIGVFYQP